MAKFAKGIALNPVELIEYQEGGIVSRELIHNDCGSITLFAFGKGQQLSPHSAPMDVLIQVVDGSMVMILEDKEHIVRCGEVYMIPASVMHSVRADENFKMIITMIKGQ